MAEKLERAIKYLNEAEASGKLDESVSPILDGMSKKLQSIIDSSTAKWDSKPLIEELKTGKANKDAYKSALKIRTKYGFDSFVTSDLYGFLDRFNVADILQILWNDGFTERKPIPTNARYFERRLKKEGIELIEKSLKKKH